LLLIACFDTYDLAAKCVAKRKCPKHVKTQHFRAKNTQQPQKNADNTSQCNSGSRSSVD